MSLTNARGAFSSTRDFICLYCRLKKIYPHGRQHLRSQHIETSHGTASSGEVAPHTSLPSTQKATQSKPDDPTTQTKAPDRGSENSQPFLSKTAGQHALDTPNPPSAEATRLQQVLQRQFAERRRRHIQRQKTLLQNTLNKKNPSNEKQGSLLEAKQATDVKQQEAEVTPRQKRRREGKSSKTSESPKNKPSHDDDPAATEKTAVSSKGTKKKSSPQSATDGPKSSKAEHQDEGGKSHVLPAAQDTSSAMDNSRLAKLLSDTLKESAEAYRKVNAKEANATLPKPTNNVVGAVPVNRDILRKVWSKASLEPPREVVQRYLSGPYQPDKYTTKHIQPNQGNTALQMSKGSVLKPPTQTGSTENIVIEAVGAADLELQAINMPQPAVRNLSYGLDRVLFNPGVYHIQDPRSRVYNFDPYLQKIMPVVEFDFDALKRYITSSRDEALSTIAREHGKRYTGSSSSMTGILAHFHYLLSQWRKIHTDMLSSEFPAKDTTKTFTQVQCAPNAVFLRWKDGHYAIDADKEFLGANILMMLGKSMEKLFTLSKDDFEKYRKSNPDQIPPEERDAPESYHYSTVGDFLMRSQLDAHDPRLPGTGMFDLKTRAVVAVRMHTQDYEKGMDYEIKTRHGAWESYEREYFDMIRAAFLKYSLQVRMGRMDGVFVAFHNTQRIFGFQYISCAEMDAALHGQWDLALGDQEFKLSLNLLNKVLDRATKKYPEQSLRIHFETREAQTPFMYIFAEPMTEDQINELQSSTDAKVEELGRHILGLCDDNASVEDSDSDDRKWADMQASVEKEMEKDEISVTASEVEEEDPDQAGYEAGSTLDPLESPNNDSIPAKTDPQDFDEALVAALREDQGIQGVEENEGNLELDLEDQDPVFQEEQDATASDQTVLSGDEENSKAMQGDFSTENIAKATPDKQSMSIQDSNEIETETQGEDQPSNDVDETASTVATEPPPDSNKETDGFNILADAPFLDTVVQENPPPSKPKGVLAMTLTIRNKVNDQFVIRPENLSSQDRWTVEYALADVQSADKAWTLYQASRARRRKLMLAEDEDEEKTADWYIGNLRELSRKGKVWRAQQDEIDKGRPKVVLGGTASSQS